MHSILFVRLMCDNASDDFILFVQDKFHSFHPVATILSYLSKAPLVRFFILFTLVALFCHNVVSGIFIIITNLQFE
jgi:hypothetical protein